MLHPVGLGLILTLKADPRLSTIRLPYRQPYKEHMIWLDL